MVGAARAMCAGENQIRFCFFFLKFLYFLQDFGAFLFFRARSDAPSYRFKVPGGHSARRADEKYKKARATEKKNDEDEQSRNAYAS